MSMSTSVIALRDMDGEFKRMIEAKLFCDKLKLSYPKEVDEYFHGQAEESEEYLREEFLNVDIDACIKEYSDDSSEGYEIDVSCLPKEVKTLRLVNSW